MSAVHAGLLCASVCRKRRLGYAWFLAWGAFLAMCPLFSGLHLKFFLECLPLQPPAFCWSFIGQQSPVEYFCDSFPLPGPPNSNADEYLFYHLAPSFRLFSCCLILHYYKMPIILQCSNVCRMYRKKTVCFMQTTSSAPIEPNCSTHIESWNSLPKFERTGCRVLSK